MYLTGLTGVRLLRNVRPSLKTLLRQNLSKYPWFSRSECFSSEVNAPFKLRTLHPKEAAAIGSSQTDHDLRFKAEDYKVFHKLDPSGYFVATTDSGEIAGVIGAPVLTQDQGAIGFLHVHNDFKNESLEELLWTAAMKHLGNRQISLDVSSDEVEVCQQLGFKEAWRSGLFKGTGAQLLPHIAELTNSSVIREIKDVPFSKVVYFDETVVGYERVNFLYKWTNMVPPPAAVAAYAEEEVVGYGVLRELHHPQTYRIGPLYANNMAMAQVLLVSLISTIPGKTYYLQSPLTNLSFIKLLTDQLYMEKVEESVRMYNFDDHSFPTHKVFGITSTDIGS